MDLYAILGVARGATVADIKRAYRRLARRYHPDINPGDGQAVVRFREVTEAYETLVDPGRRRTYDRAGWMPPVSPEVSYEFQGFDFTAAVHGGDAPTFGDLFEAVLGARARPATGEPERGEDLHVTVSLTFEESLQGAERRVSVTRRERCRTCEGRGALAVRESACRHCDGAGTVRSTRGHMVFSRACGACGGTGRHRHAVCAACRGLGAETRVEGVVCRMPPGVADGARVRVPGKGNAGRFGGESGDLHVSVQVAPHPLFRRDGDDVHLTVPVAVHEAALGVKIDVPVPGGTARLRVPPGTQSGQRFRLRERGAPSARGGHRGDLVVEVRLVLPVVLDERSKELLREFGRINAGDVRASLSDRGR